MEEWRRLGNMRIAVGKGYAAIFTTFGKAGYGIGLAERGYFGFPVKSATVGALHIHATKLEGYLSSALTLKYPH